MQKQSRDSDALALTRELATRCERALGANHLRTLVATASIAQCLQQMGQVEEALPLHQRVLAGRKTLLGEQHNDTRIALHCVGECLAAVGRHSDALPLFRAAMEAAAVAVGPQRAETLAAADSVASCLAAMGQHAEALTMFRNTLEKREARAGGAGHPATLKTLAAAGGCLLVLGQAEEAAKMLERAHDGHEALYGTAHAQTQAIANQLSNALEARGNSSAASAVKADDHTKPCGSNRNPVATSSVAPAAVACSTTEGLPHVASSERCDDILARLSHALDATGAVNTHGVDILDSLSKELDVVEPVSELDQLSAEVDGELAPHGSDSTAKE